MAGVFLSYSSQDRERVVLLAEALRAEGFEVWWDREIPVAVTYEDYIRQQLDSAGAVVVVWSPESVASRYVRWEVRRAERRGVLVPVLIEEADLPPEYFLVQSADLTRWTGDRSDREWRRLVAALVRLVGEPVQPEVAGEQPAAASSAAEVPAEVVPASEPVVAEAVPVVEEAAGWEEAAAPPAAIEAEPSAVELEPVPEEAIPILGVTEELAIDAATEVGLTSTGEEVEEEDATLAEAEVAESLRAWAPVAEEAPPVREPVGWEPAPTEQVQTEEALVPAGDHRREVPWYRRPLVLAAGGVLLLTAVVVPLVVVLSGGGEEVTTTLAASTTEAVSTTGATVAPTSTVAPTTTVAIPDVPDMSWARLPLDEAMWPPFFWGVAGGPGRVAVGYDPSGGDEDAAVYVTADGVTWERVPHDEAVFGGPGDQEMRAVTVWPGGLVAVGQDGDRGAVWTSADGLTWERVPDEAGVFGDVSAPREVWGVAAGGPGLVAVGWDESLDGAAAVWTSADGFTWERVPHDEAVFGGNGFQPMQAVARGGPGLVAVGWDGSGGAEDAKKAAVWTSTDGLTWERVADNEGVLGGPNKQAMYAVAAGGPGVVAVGWENSGGDEDAAVWASVDGLTWERVSPDEEVFGGPGRQTMFGLAVVEGLGLVAWGEDMDQPSMKGIWVSPPVAGLEWARVEYSDVEQACRMCAMAGSLLVRVGADDSGGDRDAAVWASADGLTWEGVPHDEAVFGGPGDQWMGAVVAGGPGLVAVGHEGPEGDWDAAVWASADGATWQRVPNDEAVFGGPGDQRMGAAVAGGPGPVARG
jgi:hypothetical protein